MLTINSPQNKKVRMMAVLIFGAFTMMLTETFFNNALPTIISQHQVSQSVAQWVSTGYQLVTGLMIPLSAWVFHRFNTKHTFISLLTIFLVGSVLGFFATNFWAMLVGRLIQAIAAGSMIPLIQNVVLMLFPAKDRGFIMGIIGLVIAFGPALGPTVGGWIIDNLGLKWLFGVLIPWVALLLIVSFFVVHNVVNVDTNQAVDWVSVMESCTTVLSAISNIALLSVELVLPLYLQRVHGLSAFHAGLMLLPGAILEGLMSPIAGKLYDKYGIKNLSLVGFAIIALGSLPMLFFTPQTSLWIVAGSYAFRIVGIATVMMPTFTEGLNALPRELYVHGNAASSTVRQIAGSLGTALLMMVVAFGTQSTAGEGLSRASQLNHGYWYAFLASFIFAALGFVLSFWLKPKKSTASK